MDLQLVAPGRRKTDRGLRVRHPAWLAALLLVGELLLDLARLYYR